MPEGALEVQGIVDLDLDGSGESVTIVYLKAAPASLDVKGDMSQTRTAEPPRLAWAV